MPISTADFAKFQEYKARQKTTSRSVPVSTNSQNPNFQNLNGENSQNQDSEKLPDLISWCVEDIVGQMRENNAEITKKSNLEMEEIKTKIAIKIFNEALTLAAADQIEIDLDLKNELIESESFEELMFKIALYIQTFPEFGYKLTIYILTIYISLCFKYKMLPNQEIKDIYQFFLEN